MLRESHRPGIEPATCKSQVKRIPLSHHLLPTSASPPVWVGRSVASVCLFVRALTGKTTSAINIRLGVRILYSSHSARIYSEVKRSKVKVTRLQKQRGRTVASDDSRCCVFMCYLRPLPAWVCMSIRLPMRTAGLACRTSN